MVALGKIGIIAVVAVALIAFIQLYNSRADILYGTEPPEEILTTSSCSVYVKNVGESTGSFELTVTSNNFILSGGSPTPRYSKDDELRFAEYAIMSGEGENLTFTISVSENLPQNASYTIRLDRDTWLRPTREETFNYTFDGSKYVYQGA